MSELLNYLHMFEESRPEHKEHEPKINYHFLYSAHGTTEDFQNLEEVFKKADIYVPEGMKWTMKDLRDVQAVSDGKMLPEQVVEDQASSWFQALKVMYGSQKPILFADIPLSDKKFFSKYEKTEAKAAAAFKAFTCGELSQSLKLLRVYIEDKSKLQL